MTCDLWRKRDGWLLAALLVVSAGLSLALVQRHVALRDAWRAHELALGHYQDAGEARP